MTLQRFLPRQKLFADTDPYGNQTLNALVDEINTVSSGGVPSLSGAVGDGATDDTAALQAFLDSRAGLPCTIPPGRYMVTYPGLAISSGTTIDAYGATLVVPTETNQWPKGVLHNVNWGTYGSVDAIVDENITVRGLCIDMTNNPTLHGLNLRYVRTARVLDCRFVAGGDSVAGNACADVLVHGCHSEGSLNCAWDFWAACSDVKVVNCYAKPGASGQVANFNGVMAGIALTTPAVSDGFLLQGCEMVCGDVAHSIYVGAMGSTADIKSQNIRIIGNKIVGGRVLADGAGNQNILVASNQFIGGAGETAVVFIRESALSSGIPSNVLVMGNQFVNCIVPAGIGQGLIDTASSTTTVMGNTATGCTYDYPVRFRNGGVLLGNVFPDGALGAAFGTYTTGGDWVGPSGSRVGWHDTYGGQSKWIMQADNALALWSTDASGANRVIMSVLAHAAGSLQMYAPVLFNASVGFNGHAVSTKPTVTGARSNGTALASLLTALANYGLITDSSTA